MRRSVTSLGRSRNNTDVKSLIANSNAAKDQKVPFVQSRMSVERREKIESGSNDLANKLAALSDNWSSIKHTDLEVIEEYVPDKSNKAVQPKQIIANNSSKEVSGKKDVRDAATRGRPIQSMTTPRLKMGSGASSLSKTVSGKTGIFDINKTMDELEQLKKKVHMSSSTFKHNASLKKSSLEELPEGSKSAQNRELSDREIERKNKVESLAARRATHQAAKKVTDGSSSQQSGASRHQNLMKNKKAMEEIENAFSVALRKVQEFQRDTGSHIRLNEFNKEYAKLLDSLREVVKKS